MMEAFFTKQKSEEGIHISLPFPDGTDSGHHLKIVGVDSDIFRKAERASMRRIVELRKDAGDKISEDDPKFQKVYADEKRKLIASLIVGWSLPEEFNPKNVDALLINSPYIQKLIDTEAGNRANFFDKESEFYKSMQGGTTGSKGSRKGRTKR